MADVTDAQRIAYALRRLRTWESNYRANAEAARKRANPTEAQRLLIQASTTEDVIKMLDGTDDAYIRALAERDDN